jgi:hypothetical protein
VLARRIALTGLLLSTIFVVIRALPASAAGCESGYGSLFDGFYSTATGPGGSYEGASAVLIDNSAPICDGSPVPADENFNYVFTMIHQNNSAPGGADYGYAQIGFFRYWGGCTYFTSESDSGYPAGYYRNIHTEFGCLKANGRNQYWEQYVQAANGGSGGLRLNVDSTIMDTTLFNPFTSWCQQCGPFHTEFLGETKYLGTSMPTSNFSSMQVQLYDNSWTNALPPMWDGCPWPQRYIRSSLGNNSFAIQSFGSSSAYNCY